MRGFVAVARREIAENRMVLVVALIAGVGPIAVPFVRNLHGSDAREAWSLGSFFGAVALAAGLSVAFGISTLSRGISNRQIGFFFARPLSSLTIWAGKLTGLAALILAAALLETLPSLLVSGGHLQAPFGWSLCLLLALALLLISVSHALSVALRSRSPLLALDLLVVAGAAVVVFLVSRSLWNEFAMDAWRRGIVLVGLAFLLALSLAGFFAVALGRTDIRRAHRAFSAGLWSSLLLLSLLFIGYAVWVLSPSLASLGEIRDVHPASRGGWLSLVGVSRGRGDDYLPAFLFDVKTGRSRRTGNAFGWWASTVFSSDGRHAAWTTSSSPFSGYGLAVLDLGGSNLAPTVFLKGLFQAAPSCLALSDDGSRLAVVEPPVTRMDRQVRPATLSVFELPSGRNRMSSRVDSQRAWLCFRTNDALRAYVGQSAGPGQPSSLLIEDIDIPSRALRPRARIENLEDNFILSSNGIGTRLLIHELHSKRLTLYEAATGRRLASLAEGPASARRAVFLSDGRLALAESDAVFGRRLRVFSGDGRELAAIPLEGAGPLTLAAESSPGQLVLATRPDPNVSRLDSTAWLLDVSTGRLRSLGKHLYPVGAFGWWLPGDPSPSLEPGSEGARLFLTRGGGLLSIDAATGGRHVLLPAKREHR